MWRTDPEALGKTREFLDEFHPLVTELGLGSSWEYRNSLAAFPEGEIRDGETLRAFLGRFQRELLFPVELPSIYQAYVCASKSQVRELVGLDQSLRHRWSVAELAQASRRVGKNQLRRLRPLHDQRVVQRYLRAVEEGEASGWHTLTYGLVMHVYSLPLRQGMTHYVRSTFCGFIEAAAGPLGLTRNQEQALLRDMMAPLPSALESILAEPPRFEWQSG